ncbi:aminotransferase class I/II-fold pyridoxal phosphate-dependent enzyme [Cryobacterium sp. SO2]|uniref:pyridoxal phosphate-dependent aminotransferase n=1 Tax=Cryobacterium sp. SO2 TaxID=1897060 RepID=UPI00223CCD50|nr:aminotransferase class I/II-fold pyridoxal phosphate-dependent enzyme [Cryobacterium sp. SO2]WEO77328.1 aminotransferase class I/II-fold pyridoxal phosphate-dependent enzyme [Cryobacterium sp. SO2]
MPQISSTARSIPGSGIRRIFELAAAFDDVIQLSVGEPEARVAPHILAAGARAWENDATGYSPNSGLLLLRSALVGKLAAHNGYAVDEDQVHITAGGSQALHMAMCLTLDAGDEILIPDPGYATFAMAARLVGAVPVSYRLTAERGFAPAIAELEQIITPRTRVLLINSPSNPLGVVYGPEVIGELLDFAARHDLWVISDEVYEYFTFDGAFTSVASLDSSDRVFSVYSLSKTYALTGVRVGYLVTPPGVAGTFRAAQEAIVSCVNLPAQLAAVAAIEGDQSAIADARAHYRSNLDAACAALDARGIGYHRPGGAFYLWINVSHASNGDVAAWAEDFLLTQRVAVAPGTAFGAGGEGWIRICLAGRQEPLLTALSRLPAA